MWFQQTIDGLDVGADQIISLDLSLGLGSHSVSLPDGKWGQLS